MTINMEVQVDPIKPLTRLPKRENKDGKSALGTSVMDIGVWNPDTVETTPQDGTFLFLLPFYFVS